MENRIYSVSISGVFLGKARDRKRLFSFFPSGHACKTFGVHGNLVSLGGRGASLALQEIKGYSGGESRKGFGEVPWPRSAKICSPTLGQLMGDQSLFLSEPNPLGLAKINAGKGAWLAPHVFGTGWDVPLSGLAPEDNLVDGRIGRQTIHHADNRAFLLLRFCWRRFRARK